MESLERRPFFDQPFSLSSPPGIILHPTSLPGPYGIGDLGPAAHAAVAWMAAAGVGAWQVLPLVPPETAHWSPYVGRDALCGSELLLSPDGLVVDGLVGKEDAAAVARTVAGLDPAKVDYPAAAAAKQPLLDKAAAALLARDESDPLRRDAAAWRSARPWVEDSALFAALSTAEPGCTDAAWWDWPKDLRFRHEGALAAAREKHAARIDSFCALQFLFDRQWTTLKAAANAVGIDMVGDMPIYVGGHSADVWAHRHLFALDPASGAPAAVSGVPPDAFSATGQLWGSPLYDWGAHAGEGFSWWARRLGRARELYDLTRVDHFRGFAGYWAVPAGAETAMGGEWVQGPGVALFEAVERAIGPVPIIAEDLGVITPDVTALRMALDAPGMAVLQFAWGSDAKNPHLPHNHYENCAVYTGKEKRKGRRVKWSEKREFRGLLGAARADADPSTPPLSSPPGTHDNETSAGWYADSASPRDRAALAAYLGPSVAADPAWAFVRAALASVARLAIVPLQDVLRLDNRARMNLPGTATSANWTWRASEGVFKRAAKEASDLRALCSLYGRLPPGAPGVDPKHAPAWATGKPAGVRRWLARVVLRRG